MAVPKGFENIHYILGAVMREVDRRQWPVRAHLGGPMPMLSYDAQLRVGAMLVATARLFSTDPAAFDEIAALLKRSTDAEGFDRATAARKSDAPPEKVARLVARAVFNFYFAASSARNTTGKCITNAAIALAGIHDDPTAFLRVLDEVIVREELRDKLRDRRIASSSPIARVLSRPASGKTFALVLAALEDGRFGLLVKLKNQWQWHEGDKATVFATVPDAYMAHVAEDLG